MCMGIHTVELQFLASVAARSVRVLDAEYCHCVDGLSLYVTCVLVTTAGSTKTDEPIDMPFAGEDKRARSKGIVY